LGGDCDDVDEDEDDDDDDDDDDEGCSVTGMAVVAKVRY
jgi:hypothetical protein